ncbi:MAG: PspC domain-containing protein [Microbacterium arborescens]
MTFASSVDDAARPAGSGPLRPEPPLPVSSQPASPHPDDRFFGWVGGLGVIRADGWIGGVCAGLAARWGIDPIIVRGVAIVAAVVGLPAILAYALAWSVLPDGSGRVHAVDLERGRFSYVQGAILATALVGVVHGFALLLALAALATGSTGGVVVALVAGVLVAGAVVVAAGIVALIVRAARQRPLLEADAAPAAESDPGAAPAAARVAESAAAAPPEPPRADAAPADVDAWRAQHAAWKERDRAWRRAQEDADRAARTIARDERRAAAAAFGREAAERRRLRRRARPRTSIAFVSIALGAAAVGGTLAALLTADRLSIGRGLFVAALVAAAAMVVAGAIRRRSGFLAFVTSALLVGGGAAVAVPVADDLNIGYRAISNAAGATDGGAFRQTWGSLTVWIEDTADPQPLVIDKRDGTTSVILDPGVELSLRAEIGPDAALVTYDDEWSSLRDLREAVPVGAGRTSVTTVIPATTAPTTRQTLTLEQDSGYIEIRRRDRDEAAPQQEEIAP